VLLTMHNAKQALDMGFTAAISAASAKPRLDIIIRNEIDKGKISGSRLLARADGDRRPRRRQPTRGQAPFAIAARYNTTYEAKDWGIATDVAEMIGNKRELDEGIKVMRKIRAAGIKIMPFGDYGFAWLPQGTEARDLEHFTNLFGFEPWETLRGATAYGGEAWVARSGEKMGRVAAGYLADILLVDGNPLHDLSLLQDRNALLAIMKDGQFHKPFQGRVTATQRIAAE